MKSLIGLSDRNLFSKLKNLLTVYTRAMLVVWEADPRYTFFSMLTSIFSAVAIPAQVWIAKLIIDRISNELKRPAPSQTVDWGSLLAPLGLYLGIWVVSEFFQAVSASVQELLTMKVRQHATFRMLKKGATLSIAFYETPAYYDQMELARREIWRFGSLPGYFFILLSQVIALVSLLVLLGRVNWIFPVILVLATLPRLVSQSYFVSIKARLSARYAPVDRMVNYLGFILAARETVKEIRLFHLQDYLLAKLYNNMREYIGDIARVTISQEAVNFLLSILSLLGTGVVWVFTIVEAVMARISLGDIALVFQSAERIRFSLNQLFYYLGLVLECGLYLSNYFAFLDLTPDSVAGSLASPTPDRPQLKVEGALAKGSIEFRQVSFCYPGSKRNVLQDISFTLMPGQTLALVGENGAGKTSLVKLLSRLYDPTEGQILLNGHDLRDYDFEDYYRQIGVIFQDFANYNLTARENIGFGKIEAVDDPVQVGRAAGKGGARALIDRLPLGLETMLGKHFAGSVDLSGGEWQKLALSRAFMRDADLLILDEPTAALDAYAESEIYTRFADLTTGKTTVLVTHRLSSVKMAQKILVLKEGRLIEEGNHADLLARGGEYARMFNLQAERYQS